MSTMNVSLPDELRAFVDEQVTDGRYGSTSEYVRELIRRDHDRQRLRTLLLDGAGSERGPVADDAYLASLRDRLDLPTGGHSGPAPQPRRRRHRRRHRPPPPAGLPSLSASSTRSNARCAACRRETLDGILDGPRTVERDSAEWALRIGEINGADRRDGIGSDYLERACAGSYPEALTRTGRRRTSWFDSYASRIIGRDAPDVSGLQRLGDLDRLLRLVAARNATELNQADLAADAGFAARTLPPYLDLLDTLYLTWRIPAWSTNLTNRVAERPKIALLDSGLAAHLVHVSPSSLQPNRNPEPAGPLLEAFVLAEVRKQCGWNDEPVRLYHYRDRTGPEVDLVVEHTDGRIAAIEVKATTSLGSNAARWLAFVRDRLGDRFVQGVVLYTGPRALPLGDRLTAQPIEALWR